MKRGLVLLSLATVLISNTAVAEREIHTFEDTKYHWARDYVSHLFNEGIVQGYPNSNNFGVDNSINREQVSAIISRKLGNPEEFISHGFKDIGGWSEHAISHLASKGIVKGTNKIGDIFEPYRNMSRAEFTTVINRFVKVIEYKSDKSRETSFIDVNGHWAKEEILEVARLGLINGGEDGKFNPNKNITRGEVCAIMSRMDGVVAQMPEKPVYKVYQEDKYLGSYASKDIAIREAKKWRDSEVVIEGEVVWKPIVDRVRHYIIDDQWEWGASNADGCLWDDRFINNLPDKIIVKIYNDHVSKGGSRYDIKSFAEYLTDNAPIQDNWKALFEKSRPDDKIIGYEHNPGYYYGAHYYVYIEDYPPGVAVSLNARTGWWRG